MFTLCFQKCNTDNFRLEKQRHIWRIWSKHQSLLVNKIFKLRFQLGLTVGGAHVCFLSAPDAKLAARLLSAGNLCRLLII